jgi:hypothetical protein
MIRTILFLLFLPLFSYSQNIVTHISISKVEESVNPEDVSEYELYSLKISPGYHDHYYKFTLIQIDSANNQIILSQPKINVNLTVYRNDYKRSDGKVMWDYKTEVKSNDIWTDEYIEIGNCSFTKHLTCLLRVKKSEKYKVKVFVGEKEYYTEFEIGNKDAKGM